MPSHLKENHGLSTPPCSPQRTLSQICARGNLQTSTRLPPARQSCLHNFGLWMSYCKRTCVPWDTRCRDETDFLVPCILSTKAIGALFPISSGGRFINSRRGCTTELLSLQEHGDCHSHFSSLTCSERRALKAMRQMGQSFSIHASVESNGTRVIPICPE
jgi:hypothetical protein